ncbi:MAG TPA: M6 family metalloprotease domain-containing protein [Gaiellaceae bacterium]|nr:M6 family metalloprotease domain-containing protein [Gaiellaceae bacterium]
MREKSRHRGARRFAVLVLFAVTASIASSASAEIPPDAANHPLLQPIDAQNWVDQGELTWDAYTQARPDSWNDTTGSDGSVSQYRTAVILLEFQDQPMLITQPAGAHPFGNPQSGWEPVPREDVADWYYDYYAVPNQYNGGQTLHGYWMEDSHGQIGVDVEVFGPYTLPGKLHEYGIPDGGFNAPREAYCPQGDSCTKNLRTDGGALWRADIGCPSGLCGFDNGFYVSAGHDESSTWQEFGEMMFQTRDDIPDAFGPPRNPDGSAPLNQLGQPMPNWADTRYVDWTSWRAAANHWPNAGGGTSTQAESSGLSVFAHEFSHLRGLPDNYNNPFADNERNFTGYWEMMSRGTFNGPGGTHNRWQVPNQGGSGLGPHHLLHFKNQLGVLTPADQVTLQRDTLAGQGIAVVDLKARESVPDGDLVGLTVGLGSGDLAGTCANQGYTGADVFYCPNRTGPNYLHYRLEVVDRVGNDSFIPGHGVLLTKSRNSGTPRVWMIDPNPQDIGMIDFYRPDGTPVAVVRGDPRQLNDATFHAGTRSGSAYEYVDTFNNLHFYVLAARRSADGVLNYDVGVRRVGQGDPFARGTAVGNPAKKGQRPGFLATCTFPLTNTGTAGTGVFDSDIYRLSASSSSPDWKVTLPNALAAAKAGETVSVPVHVLRDPLTDDGDARTTVTLSAASESDASKTATRTCNVHVRDTTPGAK